MNVRLLVRWSLVLLIGIPFLTAGIAFTLLYTSSGSRWIVEKALDSSGAGAHVGAFDGRLWDRFEIMNLHIDAPAAKVNIERAAVRWRLRDLFRQKLNVDAVELHGIDLILTPQRAADDSATLKALPAPPLPMALHRLVLRRFTIHAAGRDIMIDELTVGAAWDAAKFALTGFDIAAYGHRFAVAGSVAVGNRPKIAASVDWAGYLAGEPGLGSLQISGPLNELKFETSLDATVSAQFSGSVESLADQPRVSVHGTVDAPALGRGITLGETRIDFEGTFAKLSFSITTDAETPQTGAYKLSLETQVALPGGTDDAIVADVEWRAQPRKADADSVVGSGKVSYEGSSVRIDHATAAPYRTSLSGDIDLTSADPILDLEFGWTDIHYPISETETLTAMVGKFSVAGTLAELSANLTGEFDLPQIGHTNIAGSGHLAGKRFTLAHLTAALLAGEVSTQGTVDWTDMPRGDYRFSARDIDVSALRADTPSRLAFSGTGAFRNGADGLVTEVELTTVSGYLRGQALSGNAKLQTRPGSLSLERAQLDVGPNHIDVRGTWAKLMDGRFELQFEDLSAFDSRFAGTVTGSGTFAGRPQVPRIDARLQGRDLKFGRVRSAKFDAVVDIDMAHDLDSQANLTIESLMLDDKPLGRFNFAGSGNAKSHDLNIDFHGGVVSVAAKANGVWRDGSWLGNVAEVRIDSDIAGTWALVEPSAIAMSAETASLTESCFESNLASICITGKREGAVADTRVSLAAVPLRLADHYLPATLRLRGTSDGAADLRITDGVVTGTGRLGFSNGTIERDTASAGTDKLAIEAFTIDFDISPETIDAQADVEVEQWFALHGSVSAARKPGGSVIADIAAQSSDISWLADFVPELSNSSGGFELTTTLNGSFEDPTGSARLKLKDGALRVPDMGLEITGLDAALDGDPRSLEIDIELRARDGVLNMDGVANRDDENNWRYDLKINGDNFPLLRIPEAEADISPALQLAGDQQNLHVTGALVVPHVLIDVKRLPNSAVRVSEDQILVAEDGSVPTDAANSSFLTDRVSGNIAIRLGDDISINGFGLSSRLSGAVDWTKKRGSTLGRANGTIGVDEGVFKAYGQHMTIEKGRIQFAGPVDNPNLDLRAFRPELPVKAGVAVTGTIATPKISLFSDPPLSDGNTLSYIVTGRALDDASAGDSAILTQAALTLGAEQSAVVTNQIRNTFGLDELSVAAGDTVRDTSLVAGKRLSPKLSVRTDFNPFDQLWSFFLNYKLTQRWSVEAESGDRQGADLLYSIEREKLIDALLPFD